MFYTTFNSDCDGDFNVNLEKLYHNLQHDIKLSSSKFGLLKRLISQGYIDTQLLFKSLPSSTFNHIFRIDSIFVYSNIQESIIHCHTDDCPLYNTDHSMVVCAISRSDFIISKSNATQKRKHLKRKIFQFDHMTDETWASYALKIDELIIESNLHRPSASLNSQTAINSLNDSLKQILRTATNLVVPYKWSSNSHIENKPKSLVTTHQHLKQLNGVILALWQSNRDKNIWPSQKKWTTYIDLMNNIITFYEIG